MDKHYLIKLVIALFNITEPWDKDELLRLRLRNLAGEILESFILVNVYNPGTEAKSQLLRLESELEKALVQARRERIIGRKQFIFLKQEYEKVGLVVKTAHIMPESRHNRKEYPEPIKPKASLEESKENLQKENPQKRGADGLNQRQEKIIKLLAEKQQAQVGELKEFFPRVSKRTVRRDIDALLKRSLIVRKGKWNDVFYTLA